MNDYENIRLSFVIPSYNEEDNIGMTLDSINTFAPSDHEYEIIVVDNGSSDRTCQIVNDKKAILLHNYGGTIGLSRNIGVHGSNGDILIFLDADVLLTQEWREEIEYVIKGFRDNKMIVTGSRCGIMDKNNWIQANWFFRLRDESNNYINSGHLITSRDLFLNIGGFSEELRTGEDYDFGMKAIEAGALVINNPRLAVIHTGYPKSVIEFIQRERWHGSQDFADIKSILGSKQAIIAIFHVLFLTGTAFSSLITLDMSYLIFYVFFMSGFMLLLTIIKFGKDSIHNTLFSMIIFYLYFIGRSMAFIDRLKIALKIQ